MHLKIVQNQDENEVKKKRVKKDRLIKFLR